MRDFLKLLFIAVELSMLAAGIATSGSIVVAMQRTGIIALVLLGTALGVVVFVFVFAWISTRGQPPYPM